MLDDKRLDRVTNIGPALLVLGLHVLPRDAANSSTDIAVRLTPGVIVLRDATKDFQLGATIVCNSGETLTDAKYVATAVLAYKVDATGAITLIAVDSAEAASAAAALALLTEEALTAAIPLEDAAWTVVAKVVHLRTGTAVDLVHIEEAARSYGADPTYKGIPAARQNQTITPGSGTEGIFRQGPVLSFEFDAADIANGDILTDYPLPLFHGRIRRVVYSVTDAITTAAKTAKITAEIGSTALTPAPTAIAGAKALGVCGVVQTPTANHGFKPGDTLSLVASEVTSFVEGRLTLHVHLEERVFTP